MYPFLTATRLQRAIVGEPVAVVADLGEHDRAADVGQAGEAGDDLVVRMLGERLGQAAPVSWSIEAQIASSTPAGISTPGDRISIDIGIQLRRDYAPDELTATAVHKAIVGRIPDW